jgi:hypothetical protein
MDRFGKFIPDAVDHQFNERASDWLRHYAVVLRSKKSGEICGVDLIATKMSRADLLDYYETQTSVEVESIAPIPPVFNHLERSVVKGKEDGNVVRIRRAFLLEGQE